MDRLKSERGLGRRTEVFGKKNMLRDENGGLRWTERKMRRGRRKKAEKATKSKVKKKKGALKDIKDT